jgi:type I restriction enzyme S subunit
VAKLRTLVLELAIQGRLFPAMKTKPVRLGGVIDLISGQHLLAHEHNNRQEGIPYLTGPSDFGPKQPVPTRWTQTPKVIAEPGDILITVKGSGVGKTNRLAAERTAIGRQLMAVRVTNADAEFVHLVLLRAESHFQSAMTGIAIPGIGRKDILNLAVALPPLAEQRRIVAKVEELLALCDELEAAQTATREHRSNLVRSALDHLTSSTRSSRREEAQIKTGKIPARFAIQTEPDDFQKHAAFVLQHSGLVLDSVSDLREAILSLAVQGRLLPQNAKDEPATEILNQCQRAAKKLGIKSAEQTPPIAVDELPFELPSGWAWARVRHLGYLLGGGTPSKARPEFWEGTLPWVSPKDMKVAYLHDAQDHISRKALDESAVKLIPPGSILFVVRGMILIHSFPAAINKVEVTINQDMKALQPFIPDNAEFLLLACRGFKQQMLDNVERSTHGTCKLVTERVTEFVIGLPPLAEQQRIVAKVDELMRWCDALEARLTAAQTAATQLLDATLHQILAA